jgi:hypothetical protein
MAVWHDALASRFHLLPLKRPDYPADGLLLCVARHTQVVARRTFDFHDDGHRCALMLHLRRPATDSWPAVEWVVVGTHLTFPHAGYDGLRQKQARQLVEAINDFCDSSGEHCSACMVLCDFNGTVQTPEGQMMLEAGFQSAYGACHGRELQVTHRNQRGMG